MQLNRKQCNFKLNSYKQMCMPYLLKKIQFWKQLHTYTYSSSLFICYELIIVIKNNLLQNWQLSPWKELLTSFVIVELSLKKKKTHAANYLNMFLFTSQMSLYSFTQSSQEKNVLCSSTLKPLERKENLLLTLFLRFLYKVSEAFFITVSYSVSLSCIFRQWVR